jgi:hypothetical protein
MHSTQTYSLRKNSTPCIENRTAWAWSMGHRYWENSNIWTHDQARRVADMLMLFPPKHVKRL